MNRQLHVTLNKELIGTLFENQGIWSFQYETSWLATGYSLAPGLPLTPEKIEDGGLGDMRQTQPAELDRRMRCEQASRVTGGD